jgi:hypothetical protein
MQGWILAWAPGLIGALLDMHHPVLLGLLGEVKGYEMTPTLEGNLKGMGKQGAWWWYGDHILLLAMYNF